MALAKIIGEENIKSNSGIYEAMQLAKWRDVVVKLHSKGMIPPEIIRQFKARGAKFLGA